MTEAENRANLESVTRTEVRDMLYGIPPYIDLEPYTRPKADMIDELVSRRKALGWYTDNSPKGNTRMKRKSPAKKKLFDFDAYSAMSEDERKKKFPHTKVTIPGERLWARIVDTNIVMLDNKPLDDRYRYADIVQVKGDMVGEVLERVYAHRYGFRYTAKKVEAEDMPIRKDIADRWTPYGNNVTGSFFWAGMGFILTTADVDVEKLVADMTAGDSAVFEIANLDEADPKLLYQKAANDSEVV